MDFYRLMAAVEFAAASLCVLLNIVIAVVFLRAYRRSRKSFFLLLIFGTLAWLYANLFAAAAEFFGATHIRVFPAALCGRYMRFRPLQELLGLSLLSSVRCFSSGLHYLHLLNERPKQAL